MSNELFNIEETEPPALEKARIELELCINAQTDAEEWEKETGEPVPKEVEIALRHARLAVEREEKKRFPLD